MNTTRKERRLSKPWMGGMDVEHVGAGWVLHPTGLASDATVLAELMEDMGWRPQDPPFIPVQADFTPRQKADCWKLFGFGSAE